MTVSKLTGPFGVGLGATLLGGITARSMSMGVDIANDAASNELGPQHVSMRSQQQGCRWTTRALTTAFTADDGFGILGKDIAALTGGLSLWAQQFLQGGTRAAAAAHRKYNFVKGLIVWRGLSATHRGDATIEHEAFPVSTDGINSPLIITNNVSLPSGLTDARFTIGPVTVAGKLLGQVNALEIDTGISVLWEGSDSEIYNTFASILSINPTITLRGNFIEWLDATRIPIGGLAPTHANTSIYLKKRADGGTFVADGTNQHVKITAAGIVVVDNALDGSVGQSDEVSIVITPKFDGTNDPILVTPSSVIV